jgi:hypothetical protein
MTIQARPLAETPGCPPSWLRVERGQVCDTKYRIADSLSGITVNWVGHKARFRIYSQLIDNAVAFETTDSTHCTFEPDGIWRLHLTADETERLPCGGMRFTLEHRDTHSDYLLGLQGGISCRDIKTRHDTANQSGPRPPKHRLPGRDKSQRLMEHY